MLFIKHKTEGISPQLSIIPATLLQYNSTDIILICNFKCFQFLFLQYYLAMLAEYHYFYVV